MLLLLLLLPVAALLALFTLTAISWFFATRLLHPSRQVACQTPADLLLESQRVEFASRDGICLRGWWIPAQYPRGTIVFSHGYSGDCTPDLEYAQWLNQVGYNLFYFDHRGHGTSDGGITTFGLCETQDLLGAIDYLRTRGIERVGIMGFSMGGAIALLTAPLTDAIQCVVADCTFANLQTLFTHLAPQAHIPRLLAPLSAMLLVASMSIQARCNLFANSPEKSISKIAPRPVLLIQAGADELIPAAETARLYQAANKPKELWVVEGAQHRAADQVSRSEYERRITEFFERYLGTSKIIDAADRFTREPESHSEALSPAAD